LCVEPFSGLCGIKVASAAAADINLHLDERLILQRCGRHQEDGIGNRINAAVDHMQQRFKGTRIVRVIYSWIVGIFSAVCSAVEVTAYMCCCSC